MNKPKCAIGLVVLLAALALGSALQWSCLGEKRIDQEPEPSRAVSRTDLGVIYVPVTSKTAGYYGVDIDFGALVTAVVPQSPADQAGLLPGDVITSFNGTALRDGVSLARLLIECATGHGGSAHRVSIEVQRGKCVQSIELWHTTGSAN